MAMKYPPHPGGIVKDCIEELNLSIVEAANVLDIEPNTLSDVTNENATILPELAVRLSMAFGSTAEMWLRMQAAYDLAQVRNRAHPIIVQRYEPRTAFSA